MILLWAPDTKWAAVSCSFFTVLKLWFINWNPYEIHIQVVEHSIKSKTKKKRKTKYCHRLISCLLLSWIFKWGSIMYDPVLYLFTHSILISSFRSFQDSDNLISFHSIFKHKVAIIPSLRSNPFENWSLSFWSAKRKILDQTQKNYN